MALATFGWACDEDSTAPVPTETTTTSEVPAVSPEATVSVEVRDLADREGLAIIGTLYRGYYNAQAAGFLMCVDTDRFSAVVPLGQIDEEWLGPDEERWPGGVAKVPNGVYTLDVRIDADLPCSLDDMLPANDEIDLMCTMPVVVAGDDQVIDITGLVTGDLPDAATCE
jgi:hypothetical protein